MSSPGILRSFLRTSSIASPRADQTDSQSSPFSLKSSPSFNDFSLGVGAEDADSTSSVSKSAPDTPCSAALSRHSMESVGSPRGFSNLLARRSLDSSGLRPDLRALFGTRVAADGPETLTTSPSVPIPRVRTQVAAPTEAVEPPSKKPAKHKASRNQKIDGMEFYEWAELIRSSSL